MPFVTLFYMKMKQGINSLFVFSKKGWGLILFELLGLISIIYVIMRHCLYVEKISPLLLLAFVILLGYSYLSAEKYLSRAENQYDLLTGVQANSIIWAIYGLVWGKNLSAVSLFPLFLTASAKTFSWWMILPTFLVLPVAAALLACSFNILINRYWKKIAAAVYLFFSFLWGGGTAAALIILLPGYNLSFGILDNLDSLFIIIPLCIVVITILLFSSTLSDLWKEAYLQNNSVNNNRMPFQRFKRINRWFANSLAVKEWFLLWRNSITKIRLAVWAALIIICIFTNLKSYLYDPSLFLAASLAVWLFSYGELPATAWQNEGGQKAFYWISGFKPSRLIAGKIAALLPLTGLGVLTALFFGLAIKLNLYVILQRAGLVFLLVTAAIIISLAIACLGYNSAWQVTDNEILEQVPLNISAIAAVILEFLFCCLVFLPVPWIIAASVTIPLICLIGQDMWLKRIYYSI